MVRRYIHLILTICLLTDRNQHSSGMASITEASTGFPGYNSIVPKTNGFISEILKEKGFNTFALGKWHLAPSEEVTMAVNVRVDGFWMDRYLVTNRSFMEFVHVTGYVTLAERPLDPAMYPGISPELLQSGSLVFQKCAGPVDTRDISHWWTYIPGACWKHPEGPGSNLDGRWEHPVTHIAWEDVLAYAEWMEKEVPTEAEWEFACRGGLENKIYEWGDEYAPEGKMMANTWQGMFPWQNLALDGFEGTSPVASFPANGYGLYDMPGNVWEWTSDWFVMKDPSLKFKACCIPANPRGGEQEQSYDPSQPRIKIPRKVIKGGSHLCAENYCMRYRPAARSAEMIDSSTCHIGFRLIARQHT